MIRSMARILILLTLFLVPPCAFADTINFYLNGTLKSGGTATGVLSINTTEGYVNPVLVTVQDRGSAYTFIGSFYEGPYLGTIPLEYYSTSYNREDDNLLLSFPSLLVGYTGGSLCSTTYICQGFTSSFTPYPTLTADYFTTLTASAVPEPGSLALVISGMISLAGLAHRRTH